MTDLDLLMTRCPTLYEFLRNYDRDDNETLLRVAAKYGRVDILKHAIRGTMDLEISDYDGDDENTPIMEAIEFQQWEAAEVLWTETQSVLDGRRPEHNCEWLRKVKTNIRKYLYATSTNDWDGMLGCILADFNVTKAIGDEYSLRPDTALRIAARYGHVDIVERLNDNHQFLGPSDNDWISVCIIAAAAGRLSVVRYIFEIILVEYTTVCTARHLRNESAIRVAMYGNHGDVVEYLSRVSDEQELVTFVMDLVTQSDRKSLNKLSLYLQTPDAFFQSIVDTQGNTPLILAARGGEVDLVRWFVGKVDIHATNVSGDSAVAVAAKGKHRDVVKMLVEEGGASLEDLVSNHGRRPRSNVFFTW